MNTVRETSMKNMIQISCLALLSLFLTGCGERSAEVDNPRAHNNAGLEFQYPGNWKVAEDGKKGELRHLLIESPGIGLLVTIFMLPADDARDIQGFAEIYARSFKEEVPFGDVTDSVFGSIRQSGEYEILSEQFSMDILGVKTPHTRTYRRKSVADQVCFVVDQVADEHHSKVAKGVELVVSSLTYETP